ncbi:MAG: heavy metal translocating P-type ATPase [Cyclobacteriaceae bacterium]
MSQSSNLLKEPPQRQVENACYHCGQPCETTSFTIDEKSFCCYGCKTVYEILAENDLCEYYNFESAPGVRLDGEYEDAYTYLDDDKIKSKLLLFHIGDHARVQFYIPSIHCISCIWLLENLNRINSGVIKSEVNFAKKTALIDFDASKISLGSVAALLASTGYRPLISLEGETNEKKKSVGNRKLLIQLAVAGFCFGNIMLLSFPEYLGIDHLDVSLQKIFSYLNVALAIPVLLFSGADYFTSAFKSFRQQQVNIDVPIALGILVLFVRSASDILMETGSGYMDSLAGLVFFLLIGRWFQDKTYENLAFDRDYKSYFPLAVYRKNADGWKATLVHELKKGDQVRIRNKEIVPADSLLLTDIVQVDYSFVTGEAKPVDVKAGELIYAGGRIVGQPALMTIAKETSQSHLTNLWNNEAFTKPESRNYKTLMDKVAHVFTWSVLGLALATGFFWWWFNSEHVWLIVTSVLMVACPCALALAAPFTYGSMLRVFGRNGLYLKSADVVENMAAVDAIIFDKTGTITHGSKNISWKGTITKEELQMVRSVASCSTHPLSVLLAQNLKDGLDATPTKFTEYPGQGIEGTIGSTVILIGSAAFTGSTESEGYSRVYISIDGVVRGFFEVGTTLRPGVSALASRLGNKIKALLSGDTSADEDRMREVFPVGTQMAFQQSPQNKLDYIENLQKEGAHVMMLGDGLNDSGALKQSHVGIAVSDDTGVFTPACDGILSGAKLSYLDRFLSLSKSALTILKISLGISLAYNVVGLSFAVTGHLTPLVAAILMPISSISVVVFTTFMVNLVSRRVLS